MAEVRLYDSTICRLCASSNDKGVSLYSEKPWDEPLSSMINRYLPLKVHDDGKLPRTICPGCNIQLYSTVQFFQLLVNGQNKIREIYKSQLELKKKDERERLRLERQEIQTDTLESLESTIEEEITEDPFDQHIIINILPDGSVYADEHEMCLQMEGLDKPKRKRGRPPKTDKIENADKDKQADTKESVPDSTSQEENDKQEEDLDEFDNDSRRRRRRKAPKRYLEAVQGKELERIFKEEGVIDECEEDNEEIEIKIDKSLELVTPSNHEEIIGHIETIEGKELGELVIINKSRGRGRPKVRRRKNRFTCNLCNKGFSQRSRYIMHKNYHKDEKYECVECKKLYNTRDNLLLHQKTTGHSGEEEKEIIEKDLKNETFEIGSNTSMDIIKSDLEDKIDLVDELNSLSSVKNNESFATEISDESGNKNISKNDKYPCDICGKILNHPSSVIYHKKAEHNNGRRFVCSKCGKSFKHKQLLQRHQLVHSEDRPYACKSCNASFKTKANLINHQSTHTGEKKYVCEICSQQFAHKTSLTLHYRWHMGHKPYKCDVCGKSFSQNGNLQEHMRIHTGEKPYCCDYCGRKFTTSSQFKLHVKRHTGERPWKCEFCAKAFLHKDTWKCHVRRHKGEKPFQCSYCHRGFTEQWALKKHLRLHTGEKPYSCDICGKAFADCSNLTKHKKVHRENKVFDVDEPEDATVDEVWQIIPENAEVDNNALSGHVTQVIAADNAAANNSSQIIYISYKDPNDPGQQTRTLQLVDASMLPNKESSVTLAEEPVAIMNVAEDADVAKETTDNDIYDNEEIEFEDPNIQIQIIDEKGNPISLTMEQARQLLSDKNLVNQISDGQIVRVHSDYIATNKSEDNAVTGNDSKNLSTQISHSSEMETSSANKDLEDTVDEAENATISIINSPEAEQQTTGNVLENSQSFEFTTQDGQKVRLFTSYQVDPVQLESEYMAIM